MSALPSFTILALPPLREAHPIPGPTRRHPNEIARWERKQERARRNGWTLYYRTGKFFGRRQNKWGRVLHRSLRCDLCPSRELVFLHDDCGALLCVHCVMRWNFCAPCNRLAASLNKHRECPDCASVGRSAA